MDPQHNMGTDGFVWFFGLVEDRDDPKQVGRVRVRCFGFHDQDDGQLPTTALPWASTTQTVLSAAHQGIGTTPTGILEGSMVWGFFLDGHYCQQPFVVGTVAGMPGGVSDLSKFMTGAAKLPKGTAPYEPADPAKPQYPYNTVTQTEAGHVIEIDDTPGAERINVYHRMGTYFEMGPQGDHVLRSARDDYEIILRNKTLYVGGNLQIVAAGNLTASVKGQATIAAVGAVSVKSNASATVMAPSITMMEQPAGVSVNPKGGSTITPQPRYQGD
jgi:hypothetical protein